MKAFSLIVSAIALVVSGYFFVAEFNLSAGADHLIYLSILFILMLICVVGILINVPLILSERRRMKAIVYRKLSKAAMKSKRPEFSF